jgi:hypothetical protein
MALNVPNFLGNHPLIGTLVGANTAPVVGVTPNNYTGGPGGNKPGFSTMSNPKNNTNTQMLSAAVGTATLIPEVRNGKSGFLNTLTGIWTETIQPIIDNKTDAKLKAMRTIVIGASVVLIAILILVFAFKKKKRK